MHGPERRRTCFMGNGSACQPTFSRPAGAALPFPAFRTGSWDTAPRSESGKSAAPATALAPATNCLRVNLSKLDINVFSSLGRDATVSRLYALWPQKTRPSYHESVYISHLPSYMLHSISIPRTSPWPEPAQHADRSPHLACSRGHLLSVQTLCFGCSAFARG